MYLHSHAPTRLHIVVQIQLFISMGSETEMLGPNGYSTVICELPLLFCSVFFSLSPVRLAPQQLQAFGYSSDPLQGGGRGGVNHDVIAFWDPSVSLLRDSHRWTH